MADGSTYDRQTVIDAIKAIISDANLKDYAESVVDRLASFGYEAQTTDAYFIAFVMQKEWHHVQNFINASDVPSNLAEIVVDMMCGEFLDSKYKSGALSLENLDFSGIITSVTEGDTTVSFDKAGSDEARFGACVSWLLAGREGDLLCYRRIRW